MNLEIASDSCPSHDAVRAFTRDHGGVFQLSSGIRILLCGRKGGIRCWHSRNWAGPFRTAARARAGSASSAPGTWLRAVAKYGGVARPPRRLLVRAFRFRRDDAPKDE